MQPRGLIEEIRSNFKQHASVGGHYGVGALSSAVERLSVELYQKDNHFLLELIQNAEDNDYSEGVIPELLFVVTEDDPTSSGGDGCFCLFNNEDGFIAKNIRSISSVGDSTKDKRDGYVGEKGIGFKSVFTVTAAPHLFSNGYQIKFKERDEEAELSYILPYWVESAPDIVQQQGMMTSLLLPLKQEKKDEIVDDLSRIKPETILFLTKLESLNIQIESTAERIELNRDVSSFPRADLLVKRGDGEDYLSHYYLYKKRIAVPGDLDEPKREGISDRVLTLAFPLSDAQGDGIIFAYLPTEIERGFPFLVNADFLLTADRGKLLQDRDWNRWIRDSLGGAIVEAIVQIAAEPDLQRSVCRYIPIAGKGGVHYEYFEPVATEVGQSLRDKPIVLNDHQQMVEPDQVLMVSGRARELFPVEDLPEFFDRCSFVATDLDQYSKQLKVIGVEHFSVPNLIECIGDESWITSRSLQWFVLLFQYLFKHSRHDVVKSLPASTRLIPLYGGGFGTLEEQVYIQADRKLLDELKEVTGEKIAPIKLFSNRLYALLKDDESLWLKMQRDLGLKKFSLDHYVAEELVPWLDENVEDCTAENLIQITGFLVHNWEELSDDTRDIVGEQIPVVLMDGEIVNREEIEDHQLLTPKTYDMKTGWQLFLTDEEVSHCAVLSDRYLKSLSGLPAFSEFLDKMEVSGVPLLNSRDFTWRDRFNNELDDDLRGYLKRNLRESTHSENSRLATWIPPERVVTGEVFHSNKLRAAFLCWLNALLPTDNKRPVTSSPAVTTLSHYSYYGPKRAIVRSYFFDFLLGKSWVRTTQGDRSPGEVFLDTKATRAIFKDRLAYLEDDLNDQWADQLGIKREVTEEVVVDYLTELSGKQNVDPELIYKIYHYLNQNGDPESYSKYFDQHKLIYIAGDRQPWYRLNEVVWEDASAVLGSLFGWLSPVYESKDLRGFFVNKLEALTSPDTKSYADAWATLPTKDPLPEPDELKKAMTLIFREIIKMLSSEDQLPHWWSQLCRRGLQVWTQSGHFENTANVYALDNLAYARIFSDSGIEYIWKPDSPTHQRLKRLYEEIGVKPLSEVITVRLAPGTDKDKTRSESPDFLTGASKELIARMVYHTDQEYFDLLVKNGKIEKLMRTDECQVTQLDLIYENEFGDEKPEPNQAGYFDPDKGELLVSSDVDREEVMDEISSALSRFLFSIQKYKKHKDTIRRCLGVSVVRAKDIQDREGWTLSKELRDQLQQFLSAPMEVEPDEFKGSGNTDDVVEQVDIADQPQTMPTNSGDSSHREDDQVTERTESHQSQEGGDNSNQSSGTDDESSPDYGSGVGQSTSRGSFGSDQTHQRSLTRSRSEQVSRRISAYSQRRVPVYLEAEDPSADSVGERSEEERLESKRVGAFAEQYVIRVLREEGYEVKDMNEVCPNHPGYDLEAIDMGTGETQFIEVKGSKSAWGEAGVGLSDVQFNEAIAKGSAYWLFVVENIDTNRRQVFRIQDPFGQTTSYYFSGGWKALSTVNSSDQSERSLEELVEELIGLTVDSGKEIIEYCAQKQLPFPEVGYEVLGEEDGVVAEYELAWAKEKVAIVLDTVPVTIDGWVILSMDDVSTNPSQLTKYLDVHGGSYCSDVIGDTE